MSTEENVECCPPFDPQPWDGKEITWEDKKFLRDRVRSIFHIPLNFGTVMIRSMARIEAAHAKSPDMVVLSDENSLWGADVYIEVTQDVPNAAMATISGTFLSQVFEGPYSQVKTWMKTMEKTVADKGKTIKKLYFYYTTCPKCAKKYGKNYVVLLAQV